MLPGIELSEGGGVAGFPGTWEIGPRYVHCVGSPCGRNMILEVDWDAREFWSEVAGDGGSSAACETGAGNKAGLGELGMSI